MKVVFLDVDGVLNDDYTNELIPNSIFIGIDNKYVKNLKKIIDATDAQIVLSSTWRIHQVKNNQNLNESVDCLKYLKKKLDKYGLHYVSTTPHINHYKRGTEIKQWIEQNNDITIDGWVILDDQFFFDFDEEMIKHLVQTEHMKNFGYSYGLNDDDVKKAIQILNGGK